MRGAEMVQGLQNLCLQMVWLPLGIHPCAGHHQLYSYRDFHCGQEMVQQVEPDVLQSSGKPGRWQKLV